MNGHARPRPSRSSVPVDEFLSLEFGGAKAELDDGIIVMMAGGNRANARIAANLIVALRARLTGSGCFPYGSGFAVRTGERSVRYPDVSVDCDSPSARENDFEKLIGDPSVIFQVVSPSIERHDRTIKLLEYRRLSGVDEIVLVDPRDETVRIASRPGSDDWIERALKPAEDVELSSLGVTLPHAEIFARD